MVFVTLLSSLRKGCFLFITINYFNLSMKMVVSSRFYRMVNNQYFIESEYLHVGVLFALSSI